jgi:uncharacterized protein (TIGR02147 family)
MVRIHHYDSYKEFVNAWVTQQPQSGHGEYRRMSMALEVSSTMVSQIFKGSKELSLELACELAEYLSLSEDETEYFLLLVEHSRAGSFKLKTKLAKQINDKKEIAKKLENRLKKEHTLDDQAKQIYYSTWIYPAVRILTDIPNINTAEEIANRLQLPKNQIIRILNFLVEHKIIVRSNDSLSMGPAHIYLPPADPLATRNLQNWRQLAFQKMNFQNDETFFYSGQYALSQQVAEQIRKQLPDFIENILKIVRPSPSETTRCLNIDYFEF